MVPGIDYRPEELIFRQLSGRRVTVQWSEIERVELGRFSGALKFRLYTDRAVRVSVHATNVIELMDTLRLRGIEVPDAESLSKAQRRG